MSETNLSSYKIEKVNAYKAKLLELQKAIEKELTAIDRKGEDFDPDYGYSISELCSEARDASVSLQAVSSVLSKLEI